MPQGAQDKSLVANVYPLLSSTTQIALQDDVGGVANPLDVTDVATLPHRELVNLENASVNIENSSDVIIGPVTQFNVNGNVIIRHQEGRRLGLDVDSREKEEEEDRDGNKSASLPVAEEQRKRKILIKFSLWTSLALILLVSVTAGLVMTLRPLPAPDVEETPPPATPITLGNDVYQFYRRADWGARPPKWRLNTTGPIDMVIVKHTGGGPCGNFQECAPKLQTLQSLSVKNGWPDIYCSFLIGLDGNVYEGRGWGVQPQERNNTYDVVFTGSFDIDEPPKRMFGAAQALMEYGVKLGYLSEKFKVVCHNQTKNTLSPGVNVYDEVKKWPHFDPGMYFQAVLMETYPKNPPTKPSATSLG